MFLVETFNAIFFCLLVELTLHEGKDHIRACCASNGSPVLVYIFTPHSRSPSQLIVTCITARNENLDAWEQDCICTCSISLSPFLHPSPLLLPLLFLLPSPPSSFSFLPILHPSSTGYYIRQASSVFLGLLLAYLSVPVVQNLFSTRQMMNTSFDSLRIVNTYGAFGR